VDESFLKGLLHDILSVLSVTGHTLRSASNPPRVALDQNFKSVAAPVLGGSDEQHVFGARQTADGSKCRFVAIGPVWEVGWHSLDPPSL
jgi:hypothetical protein